MTVGSGLPTTSGQTMTNLPSFSGSSSTDFVFASATTLYVADDSATGSGGGIRKWTFNGSVWSNPYTLNTNLTSGCRGVTLVPGSSPVKLFATSAATSTIIVTATDNGTNASSPFTTLATPPTNTASRGIRYLPLSDCAITLDGTADSNYGSALSTQTCETGFGDATNGNVGCPTSGSELDQAFGVIRDGVLYLTLAGNLQDNNNKLLIFFDSTAGAGQNVLRGDNGSTSDLGRLGLNGGDLNNGGPGLTFDSSFSPDYCIGVNLGNAGCTLFVDSYTLPTSAAGVKTFRGSNTTPGGTGTLSGGTNPNGVRATINNSNTAGVTNASAAGAGSVVKGVELAIPLAEIGAPTGAVSVSAMIAGSNYQGLSNQVLGPLPAGSTNFNDGSYRNFSTVAGNQFFTVPVLNSAPSIANPPTNQTACVTGSASFSVTASACSAVSYQWKKGTAYLTDGVNANGTTVAGSTSSTLTFTNLHAADAGSDYSVIVYNLNGSTTSSNVSLTLNTAPTITTQPADTSVCEGGTATFTVSATGAGPLTYQWRKGINNLSNGTNGNGTTVAGVNTVTLTLTNVHTADAGGNYNVIVSNACGSVTSNDTILTVQAAPTANANGPYSTCGAALVNISGTATGQSSVLWTTSGSGSFGSASSASTTYTPSGADVTAGSVTLTFKANPVSPCATPATSNATLTIQAAPSANAGPDQTICAGQTVPLAGSSSNSTLCTWSGGGGSFAPNATTLNAVYTPTGAEVTAGTVTLTLTCTPIAPCAANATDQVTITIGTVPATPSISLSPDPICIGQAGTLTATVGGGETADWFSGSCPGGTLLLAGSTTLSITATPSATYYARARNTTTNCMSAACASITVVGETPPSVSAGPDQTICSTGSATLAGTSNISNHVWTTGGSGSFAPNANTLAAVYTPSGADITAGSVVLTLTSTNSCGSNADSMTLSINSPISISPQPLGGTAGVGSSFNFTIGASGGGLSYQWRKYPGPVNLVDGGNISGATTNSLTINPVGVGDAGTYDCLVSNACGPVASNQATLAVSTGATVSLVPTQTCIDGGKLIVEINLSSAPTVIVGGQFFLNYNTSYLTLLSADPGDAPFTREIYDQQPVAGDIDYAVGIEDGGSGTSANTTMARLSFGIVQNLCTPAADLVTWRASGPNGAINQLSDANGDSVAINPLNLTAIKIDNTDPVLTGCPGAPLTAECGSIPAPPTVTANDNCDGAITPIYAESAHVAGVCPVKYTFTRSWTATDACGNTATCTQNVSVEDHTGPVLSGCPGAPVTIECGASPPAYTVTATDGCDGSVSVSYGESAHTPGVCPVKYTYTRTWTATDLCGNSSACSQLVTVQDTTAPVLAGCPATTETIECGSSPSSPTVTASDACQGAITPVYSESVHTPGVCPVKYTYTRTWTATDACGNASACSQVVTVEDHTGPVLAGCPVTTLSLQCYSAVPVAATVTATDGCDGAVTPVFNETQTNPGSSCNNVITRTWTATDACGNANACSQTITVNDTVAPVLSGCPATTETVECGSSPSSPTVTALDACQGAVTPVYSESAHTPGTCPVKYTYTRTWTATDSCGNASACSQVVTVEDHTGPVLAGCPATTLSLQCYSAVPVAATVTATDGCDGAVTVHFNETQTNPGSSCNNVITRTWTATDACNNSSSCTQTITVNDTIAPTFTCPATITVTPLAGSCTANPTISLPDLADNCDPAPAVTFTPAGPYGPGTTPVTVTATDACNNSSSCVVNVVVNNYNELALDVELGGGVMMAGPYQRAITVELWNGASMVYSTCQTFSFTSGNIPVQTLQVPCGTYTCITARDRLHTLRRTINLVTGGAQYTANFTGATKKLIGGNLNDDKFIDILDFGIYTLQDLTAVGANTNCSINPPTRNSDVNGDGIANSLDFSFISNNFLQVRDANCDGNPNTITASDNSPGGNYGLVPITSITVGELAQRGMPELAVMDLNRDGVLNQSDVQLWMQGVRPGQNPGGGGRPGSGGPTRPVDVRPIGVAPAGRE